MFYLLCLCLILAVMFIVFMLTALTSLPALRVLLAYRHLVRAGTAANFLFIIRALPLVLGIVASLGLALPAFWEFEPSATHEMPGPVLRLLAGLGVLMIVGMFWRISRSVWVTLSLQRMWLKNASPLAENFKGIPVFCVKDSASLVAVAGIFVPRIFLSQDVADVLNTEELNAALAHELAHVSTKDNLRQFVLKMMPRPQFLPFLSDIDSLWSSTSELAADERAIVKGTSPLDLSSALIKVGRLSFQRGSTLLAASHLVDGCSSATHVRAGHLRHLLEHGVSPEQANPTRRWTRGWTACAAVVLLLYLLALWTLLPEVHDALEFIVR